MTKKDKNQPMIFRRKKSKERKISEMVLNFAGDYIAMGDDIEDKQQYLNGAVSAWNIACLDEKARRHSINKYMAEYQKLTHGNVSNILPSLGEGEDEELAMRFLEFIEKTQGQGAARERIREYLKDYVIKKYKTEAVKEGFSNL